MTDKEALYSYRLKQAEETLEEAKKMLEGNFSPRQEGDYKEFVDLSIKDATEHVKYADAFLKKIKEYTVNQGDS